MGSGARGLRHVRVTGSSSGMQEKPGFKQIPILPMARSMLKYAYNKISMSAHSVWTIVFYLEDNGGNPVDGFLNGFQKKSPKTPAREIATAVKRMQRFVEREGGES